MNRKQVLLATSTVLLSGALAHAQGTQPQSSQQQQQPQQQKQQQSQQKQQKQQQSRQPQRTASTEPVAGVVPLGVTVVEEHLIAPGYRASRLLRQKVYNDKGEKIGEIDDLVVAPDGTLSAAVVEVGGFLGVGKRHVAIPLKQFTAMHPKVTLPGATKEALKGLPEFIPA